MCDTLVVVRPDGVLFAKNSDRDANEAQVLEWHPAADHPPGAEVRTTRLTVPQVERTHAVVLSRPFWMWGAEMGANEHGVVVGNEAVFTDRPYRETGLTGMDLLRLALERARTAVEAVGVIVDLLETHGQGGGCGFEDPSFTYHNSFLVADPSEAWVLETADDEWATERVTVGVRTISNGLTIPGFAEAHRDRLRTRVARCDVRRRLTARLAEGATDPRDLAVVLRSHGSSPWPRYHPVTGTLGMPCMHGGGMVGGSVTAASWISDVGAGLHLVTATSSPCLSLFVPVRVDEPVDLTRTPGGSFDGASLWWRHERLHRLVLRDPPRLAARFLTERDTVEAAWFTEAPPAAEAFAARSRLLEEWTERVAADAKDLTDARPWWARRWWKTRDRAAGLP